MTTIGFKQIVAIVLPVIAANAWYLNIVDDDDHDDDDSDDSFD